MSGKGDSFDRLKKTAGEHSDKAGGLVGKAAEAAKKVTGGKYDDKIDKGADAATDYLRKQGKGDTKGGGGGDKKP